MGSIIGYLKIWYNEGLPWLPPPCMYSKTCYKMVSANACCVRIGKLGTEWGERNRAPIFFWAFWLSFLAWILLAAALGCVSTSASVVSNVPFFQGTIKVTHPVTLVESDFNYYAGLNRVVVEDCDLGDLCPPHSQPWDSVTCQQYFSGCDSCRDASEGSVTLVIMSFVTQFPQLTGDLERSTRRYDMHCQKTMGILTGILGLLSTLAALNAFGDTCFASLESNMPELTIDRRPGTAFILLLVATVLKVVDIWAHVIVPVPDNGYWRPDGTLQGEGEGYESQPSKTIELLGGTEMTSPSAA